MVPALLKQHSKQLTASSLPQLSLFFLGQLMAVVKQKQRQIAACVGQRPPAGSLHRGSKEIPPMLFSRDAWARQVDAFPEDINSFIPPYTIASPVQELGGPAGNRTKSLLLWSLCSSAER
jgi:hypothetical protein